jgi:AraC-like DNA-binding protein
MSTIIQINSISELHKALNIEEPKHSLITIINVCDLEVKQEMIGVKVVTNLYSIAIKDVHCGLEYGRTNYDFENGTLLFTAPYQALIATKTLDKNEEQGWLLFFHPDLLRKFSLAKKINEYNFFGYFTNEALHLTKDERNTLNILISNIRTEFTQTIDHHCKSLIISNLELLLNYSMRYYERQFSTRSPENKSNVANFESILNACFDENITVGEELTLSKYLAQEMNLSSNYLSDLLKKETGYSTKDHINNIVLKRAKDKLLGTNDSVREIAFSLGYNYSHYFTRFFKSKTGMTPSKYRKVS